jgi:hypothetical protein
LQVVRVRRRRRVRWRKGWEVEEAVVVRVRRMGKKGGGGLRSRRGVAAR